MAGPSNDSLMSPSSSKGSNAISSMTSPQLHEDSIDKKLASLLSSDDFSIAAYLNLAFADASAAANDNPEELQQRMAELALQLQLQTQSCHEEIGRIGAELQAILPRCAADVGRVGVGLEGMRIDAAQLLESTSMNNREEEEQEASSSLQTLSTLHALQSNLSITKDILTAAATWDSTLSSVAPMLSQQNLTEAVHALAQLESGERALRGMPHPEERSEAIAKVRQQVQVLLQPQLKHALQNMNTRLGPLHQCVSLYIKLGKLDALKEEYIKNRPAAVHKLWFAYTPTYSTGTDKEPPREDQSSSFLSWLPGWYDAVLSLITEERRQSLAVFGPELVPEIVVKVVREAFRPILPSFQSRLESLYSSNPAGPTRGSLESICAVYEATLQFLSLTYENVAGGWLDMSESGLVKGDGSEIFQEISSIFMQVASPFALYQERLPQLEAKNSGVAAQLVSKDIKAEVASVASAQTTDLAMLQDATDRLKGLSSFIFPLAESALARFELMNGGYRVGNSIATIDKLIAGHAEELSGAILSLSRAMTADEQNLADAFDDQHVLCALDVLKIAGTFRRDMRSFESRTRERISVLYDRMSAHVSRELEIEEASSNRRSNAGSSGSFVLPDSLSVVEIDSYLTKTICGGDNEVETSLARLNALVQAENSEDQPSESDIALFKGVKQATKELAKSCHSFVFDVCSAVPVRYLTDVPSMTAWKEANAAEDIASYGTLPQQYVTHVGEHMLALVQALEPFASDSDALALANEVMADVREVAMPPWREVLTVAGTPVDTDSVAASLMAGDAIMDLVIGVLPAEDDLEEEDDANKESTAFCNAWLDAVGLAVTGRLLERIMRIPNLSSKGCEHIAADLNYLVNVFSALGLSGHPHPLLGHLAELAVFDLDNLNARISNFDRTDDVQAALQCIEQRIASMRDSKN